MEAFARVELGLTAKEFGELVPAQWQALLKAFSEKNRRDDQRLATLMATIYNTAGKSFKPVAPEELLTPEDSANG